MDIAKSLKDVFRKYSRDTRETAWKRISSSRGDAEVHKIIVNPNKDLNTFAKLVFKEWLELDEMIGDEMIGEKFKYQQQESLKRAISTAIMNLKYTAPEVFEFKNGEPSKINTPLDLLISKLRDRGLIPSNINPDRFAALVKTWVNRPVDDRLDFSAERHSDEFVHEKDLPAWRAMQAKSWG